MPPSPIPYPLEPASVSGTLVTVDEYLAEPTVITRTIAQLAAQRFYADRVFRPGPDISGGTLLFSRPNPLLTDLYGQRRTQEIAPGTQFPVQTFQRGIPMVQAPRKIGEKFSLTKEERKRNRVDLIDEGMVQAANTISRDVEIMALSELNAVIAATGRTVAAGSTWSAAAATTFNTKTAANQPVSDLVNVWATMDLEERGHLPDTAILHTTDWANLVRIYGADEVDAVLRAVGITEHFVTPRQTQGRVKLFKRGQVGVWSNEFPLDEDTWEEKTTDRTWWYQWSISPLFAVTDQFAILELTGV